MKEKERTKFMKKRGFALFLTFCLSVGSIVSSVGTEQVYATESNQTEGGGFRGTGNR